MEELFQWFSDVCINLIPVIGDSDALMAALSKPEFVIFAYVILNLVIFTETGLLVGFFLPGDSLLVTTGLVAYNAEGWSLPVLMITLTISAIVGDSVGYLIGYRAGPRLFKKEKSFFFRKDYLVYAQNFYERHGGKTIVIARFVPFLRTFAPVVAGIGRMQYSRFLSYNVFGGIGWICSMLLVGYYLTPVLDPMLQPIFGTDFQVRDHIEKVILLVVFLSILPGIIAGGKHWIKRRSTRRADQLTGNAV